VQWGLYALLAVAALAAVLAGWLTGRTKKRKSTITKTKRHQKEQRHGREDN
jgi:hypothetical protein